MGIMRFNFRSQSLGRYVDVTIAYPTDNYSYYDLYADKKGGVAENPLLLGEKKGLYHKGMEFQTVYLIHGGGDDDTLTYRYTNAERYAQENNVMLVTPNVSNSFGVDTQYGVNYQRFISEELPVVIQSLFASSDKREDNFIVGYAMGGNAALGTAIMNPDKYCHCVDMSGGIGMTFNAETMKSELEGDHFRNFLPIYNTSFGDAKDYEGSKYDLNYWLKKYQDEDVEMPKFTLICGSDEFIRARMDDDARLMKEAGLDVDYIIADGYKHDFDLWEDYIRIILSEILPLKRKSVM